MNRRNNRMYCGGSLIDSTLPYMDPTCPFDCCQVWRGRVPPNFIQSERVPGCSLCNESQYPLQMVVPTMTLNGNGVPVPTPAPASAASGPNPQVPRPQMPMPSSSHLNQSISSNQSAFPLPPYPPPWANGFGSITATAAPPAAPYMYPPSYMNMNMNFCECGRPARYVPPIPPVPCSNRCGCCTTTCSRLQELQNFVHHVPGTSSSGPYPSYNTRSLSRDQVVPICQGAQPFLQRQPPKEGQNHPTQPQRPPPPPAAPNQVQAQVPKPPPRPPANQQQTLSASLLKPPQVPPPLPSSQPPAAPAPPPANHVPNQPTSIVSSSQRNHVPSQPTPLVSSPENEEDTQHIQVQQSVLSSSSHSDEDIQIIQVKTPGRPGSLSSSQFRVNSSQGQLRRPAPFVPQVESDPPQPASSNQSQARTQNGLNHELSSASASSSLPQVNKSSATPWLKIRRANPGDGLTIEALIAAALEKASQPDSPTVSKNATAAGTKGTTSSNGEMNGTSLLKKRGRGRPKGKKIIPCSICGRPCKSNLGLKKHVRSAHFQPEVRQKQRVVTWNPPTPPPPIVAKERMQKYMRRRQLTPPPTFVGSSAVQRPRMQSETPNFPAVTPQFVRPMTAPPLGVIPRPRFRMLSSTPRRPFPGPRQVSLRLTTPFQSLLRGQVPPRPAPPPPQRIVQPVQPVAKEPGLPGTPMTPVSTFSLHGNYEPISPCSTPSPPYDDVENGAARPPATGMETMTLYKASPVRPTPTPLDVSINSETESATSGPPSPSCSTSSEPELIILTDSPSEASPNSPPPPPSSPSTSAPVQPTESETTSSSLETLGSTQVEKSTLSEAEVSSTTQMPPTPPSSMVSPSSSPPSPIQPSHITPATTESEDRPAMVINLVKCPICAFLCMNEEHQSEHMSEKHPETGIVFCTGCFNIFLGPSNLKKHKESSGCGCDNVDVDSN